MKWNRLTPVVIALLLAMPRAWAETTRELVFVGSGRMDIDAFRFDLASGVLTRLGRAARIAHPSFLALAPNHRFLYAVSEGPDAAASSVSAFSIDEAAGTLSLVNSQPAGGAGPCCVQVDADGRNALIANYNSGSFAVFPLDKSGALRPMSAFIQDHGSSINPDRQQGPHSHCIVTDAADRFAFACDLGLDKVMVFRFDPAKGALLAADPPFVAVKAGAGPRHIAFHPNGRWAYVINEMASTITAFSYDATRGTLGEFQTESTLPKDFSGQNTDAEVAVHPSGNFVYGSNRGDDSIAVFSCDAVTGRLTFVERDPTGGKTPRQFEIDPSGRYLLVGNQGSDTVVVFLIDEATGHLRPTGNVVHCDNPACVRCLPQP
ncbi:MAG: beta-propeller fold lactonase family protein [Verrucomicrobiota bacterium]|jgi:6-phosphogluconolactonase